MLNKKSEVLIIRPNMTSERRHVTPFLTQIRFWGRAVTKKNVERCRAEGRQSHQPRWCLQKCTPAHHASASVFEHQLSKLNCFMFHGRYLLRYLLPNYFCRSWGEEGEGIATALSESEGQLSPLFLRLWVLWICMTVSHPESFKACRLELC